MEKIYRQSSVMIVITLMIDVILMMFFIGFLTFPLHLLIYLKNSLTINSRGVILRRGILTVRKDEIPYSKINSVSTKRGVLGSIFGYGDIVIYTGNDVSGIPFKGIENPEELKNEIMNRSITNNQSVNVSVSESSTRQGVSSDIYKEIEKLAKLKDSGILTEEEFIAKKKSLLNI